MQMADCMAMPYRHIDQSGVLFMALSASLPVVATNVGSIANYLQAGEVVPVGDVPAFSAALIKTLDATAAGRQASSACARYEWRNTVAPLVQRYERPNHISLVVEGKE
jgi:glycosyltransferase involved in cell wall biosynthesis